MNYMVTFYIDDVPLDITHVHQEMLDEIIVCYRNKFPFYAKGICLRMEDVKYIRYKEQ